MQKQENRKKYVREQEVTISLGRQFQSATVLEKYEYLTKPLLANGIRKHTLVASSCAVFKEWIKNFELSM